MSVFLLPFSSKGGFSIGEERAEKSIFKIKGEGIPEARVNGYPGWEYTDTLNGLKYIKISGQGNNIGWLPVVLTKFSQELDAQGNTINNIPDPILPHQVVPKQYVDNLVGIVEDYVSHYNTQDGTSDGGIEVSPTSTSRKISSPSSEGSPFKIGDWSGGDFRLCYRNSTVSFNNSQQVSFVNDSTTTVEVRVLDADGTSVISSFITDPISGIYDSTSGFIRVRIIEWESDFSKFKARILVDVMLNNLLPGGGRFSIQVIHYNAADGDFSYSSVPYFYDTDNVLQSLSGISIDEHDVYSSKYLSGIRYYDKGDDFEIHIPLLDEMNHLSFPRFFANFKTNSFFGISDRSLEGSDLFMWSVLWNNTNASFNSVEAISRNNFRYIGDSARATAQVIDWSPGSSKQSPPLSVCIDTWNAESDELSEYFTDESFRTTSTDIPWDSSEDLISYDDAAGLMIQKGKLQIRNSDWTSYSPGTTSNPDYSSVPSSGTYYRFFTDLSSSVRNSVQFEIGGFNLQDLINERVKLWILIPGKWTSSCFIHGSSEYDFGSFNGDNDPIRTNDSSSNIIRASFGVLGLDSYHNSFRIHLEIHDPSINPDYIRVSF